MTTKNATGSQSRRTRTQLLRELSREAEARGRRATDAPQRRPAADRPGATLTLWEAQQRRSLAASIERLWSRTSGSARTALIAGLAFVLGLQLAARPDGAELARIQSELDRSRVVLQARQGELELVRLEIGRLQEIMDYSRRYAISADLATLINDIALAEGIAPALAFRLVQVESGFYRRAISPVGAVGLAQLMPRTAYELDPSLSYAELFDPETNLRLGMRYLRQMIDRYDGDLRLALLAYNRGPGTVDSIRRIGGDPANGYARAVMGGSR